MIKDLARQLFKLPVKNAHFLPPKKVPIKANQHISKPPLDPESPWPKFRGNSLQNGRSVVKPTQSDMKPWTFQTGKGIFSSPVIDKAGTVYIGSADHYFYALTETGELKWKFATREIIDSSALLDDRQRVYFGSGDGHVYCLDRNTGTQAWKFKAHSTKEVKDLFGITPYNLNWFEGNIAILGDGTLLAPNDNYLVYALDRETGQCKTQFPGNEMIWSCPAVNTKTNRIFFGSCFIAAVNVFCYQADTGKKLWTSGGLGTISASSMLTSDDPNGAVIIGGFDGILRALSQKNGKQLWAFGTRDHIYGSPAQLSSGTIVQASCDGTVYGLDPITGKPVWTFDTPEPIRSSPVVDADDHIYFGSGEGRLYCINKDGSFRWAYQCIDGDRNDLNGSCGLGPHGVCIAGENGGIFFVPYDYPLTPEGQKDKKSILNPDNILPRTGSHFFYVTPFGRLLNAPPDNINANDPILLTHYIRENGKTLLSAIDVKSLEVSITGNTEARINVSANRKFITLIPKETWAGPDGGRLNIQVRCRLITRLKRFGLKFFLGKKTHVYSGRFTFQVAPYNGADNSREIFDNQPVTPDNNPANADNRPAGQDTVLPDPGKSPASSDGHRASVDTYRIIPGNGPVKQADDPAGKAMPYRIPEKPGYPSTIFEISRLSCPSPTMLPSYNQIGFDSLHYLAGIVEGNSGQAILWVVPGRLDETTGKTMVNPALKDIFVLQMAYKSGLVTFYNYDGFMLSFVGSWDMPFALYRIAARVDPKTGQVLTPGALNAVAQCDKIKLYGKFLKLMGMSDMRTGLMHICGGLTLNLWNNDRITAFPPITGTISLDITPKRALAKFSDCELKKQDHVFGILLVQDDTHHPVSADYARKTQVETDNRGVVTMITLEYNERPLSGMIRGYIMVDTCLVFQVQVMVKK